MMVFCLAVAWLITNAAVDGTYAVQGKVSPRQQRLSAAQKRRHQRADKTPGTGRSAAREFWTNRWRDAHDTADQRYSQWRTGRQERRDSGKLPTQRLRRHLADHLAQRADRRATQPDKDKSPSPETPDAPTAVDDTTSDNGLAPVATEAADNATTETDIEATEQPAKGTPTPPRNTQEDTTTSTTGADKSTDTITGQLPDTETPDWPTSNDNHLATVTPIRTTTTAEGDTVMSAPTGELNSYSAWLAYLPKQKEFVAGELAQIEVAANAVDWRARYARSIATSAETAIASAQSAGLSGDVLDAVTAGFESMTAIAPTLEELARKVASMVDNYATTVAAFDKAVQSIRSHGAAAETLSALGSDAASNTNFYLA